MQGGRNVDVVRRLQSGCVVAMVDGISRARGLGSDTSTTRERKETESIERRHGGERMGTDSALPADIANGQWGRSKNDDMKTLL